MQLNAPREHRRDRLRALDADLVLPDVEVGQGGADVKKRAEGSREWMGLGIRWGCGLHERRLTWAAVPLAAVRLLGPE